MASMTNATCWLRRAVGDFVHAAIRKSDLIVNIGHDVIEKPPFFMAPTVPGLSMSRTSRRRSTRLYFRRSRSSAILPTRRLAEGSDHDPHGGWSFGHAGSPELPPRLLHREPRDR
jgi:acetolactate synthase-1/2/3 large subunit